MKLIKWMSVKTRLGCIGVMLAALIGAYLSSIWPVRLSSVYNAISEGSIFDINSGILAIMLFAMIFIAAEAISTIRRIAVEKITASFEKEVRDVSFNKLLRLPAKFYSDETSGEYTAKINQAVGGVSHIVKAVCNNVIPVVFVSGFTIWQILCRAPKIIAIVLVSFIVFETVASYFQIKLQNGAREKIVHKRAALDGTICQAIQHIEMIRVTAANRYENNRVKPITEDIKNTECRHHEINGIFDGIKQLLKVTYIASLLIISLYYVSIGRMESVMVISVILLFQQLMGPVDQVHAFLDEIASNAIKVKDLMQLMEMPEDDVFKLDEAKVELETGDLSVSKLCVYVPGTSKRIVSDCSFVARKKNVTALVGPTGAGKSSILKGIMRYFTSEGDILIEGKSIRDCSQEQLCKSIYNMVQQPVFIAGNIRDNLIYGLDITPSDKQLIDALKNAYIYDELCEKTSDVLSIEIAENASNFSGGQRQRIAIARAFLRSPQWFFLDECTANIDNATTYKIIDKLIEYAKSINAGILLVSHQDVVIAKCNETINITSKERKFAA